MNIDISIFSSFYKSNSKLISWRKSAQTNREPSWRVEKLIFLSNVLSLWMTTIRTIQIKFIFSLNIFLDQLFYWYRFFSANWMQNRLWRDVKRDNRCVITYLRIPNISVALLVIHTEAGVFIWFPISLLNILLLQIVRTNKLSDRFE